MNPSLTCQRLTCLLPLLAGFVFSYARGPVHTHVFQDGVHKKISFHDSLYIFIDQHNAYNIEGIINATELEFVRPPQTISIDPPYAVWTKLILINKGKKARNEYFSFCLDAETSWIYTVEHGQVIKQQYVGSSLKPFNKSIPSIYHYIPVSIDAGKEKTFYFKFLFTKPVTANHLTHLSIQPAQSLIYRVISDYAWNSFYAGFMFLFCVFSLFMFGMFRENIFIHFAALTLFFGLYFMHISGMIHVSVANRPIDHISVSQFIVSGLVFSIFSFVSGYLSLKRRLLKYYRFFLIATIVCIAYAAVPMLFQMTSSALAFSHNILLIVWALSCIAPVIFLTYKKDKEARILLASIGMLFLGALLFLIASQNIKSTHSWMRFGFQIGSVLFCGILFYGLFDKINTIKTQKRELEELDGLKSRFFANISHEFRTPLTLMLGPLQQLLEKTGSEEDRELLKMAHRNAGRQLRLVNQLLDLSKLVAGKMTLEAAEEDFIPFLSGMVHAYESLAAQKNISVKLDYPPSEFFLWFDREKMEKIFFNLLSNAFKFTPPNGSISIVLKKKKDKAFIAISDTGQGISSQSLPHVFDRFFQGGAGKNDMQEGSGIGLPLSKELVELHGGTIEIESKEGKGTTVVLHFPLGNKHLKASEIAEHLPTEKPAASIYGSDSAEDGVSQKTKIHSEAPLVLIIEDNDDVRVFMRQRLEGAFYIIEAKDGEEGIKKALEKMPDLIISDVMMPKKDGYEVCKTLKTDIRTSHIPIILLTAKAAQGEKLEGLETGADDYLTKPFDSKELLVRVENLIRLRQQLRQRFAKSVSLKPSEVATNSMDQAFLKNALQIVEANMENEAFSIEILARELGMSRPNLNRKFRALINQPTNQFIQSVRLQRAADLLGQQAGTVSEIAFQTGFSSSAYFVKCFKEQFGETPGNFSKKEKSQDD